MIKLPDLTQAETDSIVPPKTILLGYVGSIAHGTHIPSSNPDSIDDQDIMGICVGEIETYLGLRSFEQKITQYKSWDSCIYEIRKYFRLLLKQNPNVISLLWLRPEHYIYISPIGQQIIDNRNLFASKESYKSFTGYAYAQLQRMERFRFEGYMGAKRKELVERFGYDAKNGAHLIRLMRMCNEYLETGEFIVCRPDAEELKAIKTGQWQLEKIKEEAHRLFLKAGELVDRSRLPEKPDYKKAEELLISILREELL